MTKRNVHTEAIVLKTYNVGETDRYCIVLSKDLGRLHVRANGARKTGSKLGPCLLGMQCIELDVYYSSKSTIVQQAHVVESVLHKTHTSPALEPLIECCLALLPEEEPLPEVYDVLKQCITDASCQTVPALLCVLNSLGYIPDVYSPEIVRTCTKEEHDQLVQILQQKQLSTTVHSPTFTKRLLRWVTGKIEQEAGKPLRSLQVQSSS